MKKIIKHISIFLLAALVFFSCEEKDFRGKTLTRNEIGTLDGYSYEFWMEGAVKGSMTLGPEGTFSCEWTSTPTTGLTGNILFRRGRRFNSSQTHSQIGDIKINYKSTYTITSGNVSYLCVYGWTRNPLIEYYIVESFGGYRPPGTGPGVVSRGSITIDGATYDLFESTRTQQPSIDGTRTFQQYWSVRRNADKRTSGTVSVSEHFKKWDEVMSQKLGRMYEVALTVEGYGSSGYADITENEVIITK